MQTKAIKIDSKKIDIAKIKEAADIIDSGGLVAFPTETVYGIACRVKSDSLTKLDQIKTRQTNKPYSLHISQKNEVVKYVPTIGLRTEKLINKAWPGPLTIVFELSEQDISNQSKNLQKDVFENLYKKNSIGIRCPDNIIATTLLRLTHNPVVAPSANITGQKPSVGPQQVLTQLSGQIELLIDGGPCKYKTSSTVVKIGKKGLQVLRAGVYSKEYLEKLLRVKILFVCTGNTCRSPIAEEIFRKYLSEKLHSEVDQLKDMGYIITSAGLLNMDGYPASEQAIAACAEKGIDITAHKSTKLTQKIIEDSDLIFVMTRAHCRQIAAISPENIDKCQLLAENKEIPDPLGQSKEFFKNCADMIEEAVKKRISELVL